MQDVRIFSFGGGVQSVACLALAARGVIDYKTFVFADVGEDSEHPGTVAYMRDHAIPFAAAHGLELVTVAKRLKDGTVETLLQKLHRTEKSLDIPVRMSNGAPGNRSCTADFKIKPVGRYAKELGASVEAPAVVGIGISQDEAHRMKPSQIPYLENDYPLVRLGLDRTDCKRIIQQAGLPIPPKSSCWFCPYHTLGAWRDMLTSERHLFDRAVALERMLNERRAALGKDPIFFSSRCVPLDRAVYQIGLFTADENGRYSCGPFTCDGGEDRLHNQLAREA